MFSGGHSVIIEGMTKEEFLSAISEGINNKLSALKKDFTSQNSNEDLMTREETCKFLSIDSSTLWAYTNKGKVKAYGIGARRYYKRTEILESLKLLKH